MLRAGSMAIHSRWYHLEATRRKEAELEGCQAALRAKEAELQACQVKLNDGLNTKGAELKELREPQDPLAVMLIREAEPENCQARQYDHEYVLQMEEVELRPLEDALQVELDEQDKGHTLSAETTTGAADALACAYPVTRSKM